MWKQDRQKSIDRDKFKKHEKRKTRRKFTDDGRQKLIDVAHANDELVLKGKVTVPKTIQVDYDEKALISNKICGKTSVFFETMKTDECALYYLDHKDSKYVTIMNFASRHSHGGGYKKGARAQEEHLFRVIPAFYASVSAIRYPYPDRSVLITPDLEIMRDSSNYKLLQPAKVRNVGAVSVAAQNLRFEEFDEKLVRQKLATMYCAVKRYLQLTDTFILGAWDLYFIYKKIRFNYINILMVITFLLVIQHTTIIK